MNNFKIVTPVNLITLNNKNEILLLKRADDDSEFGGYWCIPGGETENFETFEEALKREIKEETNSEIIEKQYLKSFYYEYKENLHVRAIYFHGKIQGEIKLDEESSDFKWFTFEEILDDKFELAFNQKEVLKDFINFYKN
ncbi:MAG: NUDIX hydrolase [Candidatus Woesearchaeota archaeon]|jgi:8-oxo-dGTP diphosphatase|nr:NUDIX hydrolase [Candidatus Woesearchaeota archaeon]